MAEREAQNCEFWNPIIEKLYSTHDTPNDVIYTDGQCEKRPNETIHFDDLKELGDEKAVKAAGRVRLEGKDYIVQDGDFINFRFNV